MKGEPRRQRLSLGTRIGLTVAGGVTAALVIPTAAVVSVLEPGFWSDGRFVSAFAGAAVSIMAVAALVAQVATKGIVGPLKSAIDRLEAVAIGDDDPPRRRAPTVPELERLDALVDQLVENAWDRERRFTVAVGALAHDARASLSAVHQVLRAAQRGTTAERPEVRFPPGVTELLLSEIERLQALTTDLVMIMRPQPVAGGEVLVVDEVVREVADSVASATSVPVSVVVTKSFERRGARLVLDRLLRNVIENAAKAARNNVTIEVLEGLVIVNDDGGGMPEEVAVGRSVGRRAQTGAVAHGFGLEIAQRLAGLLGGRLVIERTGPSGTTVLVYVG